MSTRHLVDPDLLPLLAFMPPLALDADLLPAVRTGLVTTFAAMATSPAASRVVALSPVGVSLDLYLPDGRATAAPTILYIHGGGFVMGSAGMMRDRCWELATTHGAVVAAIDYRLAPEASYPAALDDCHAGLAWLVAHAADLGIDHRRIVVMGDSAGGGLAAALALKLRDLGEGWLAAQFLNYPMLDHRTGTPQGPVNAMTGEFGWNRAANRFGWTALRGDTPVDDALGYFSPALAKDLNGLPPTFVVIGALDLFLDETVEYTLRLARAGVPVESHVYPGVFHGGDMMGDTPVSRQFAADRDRALSTVFARDQ